MGHKFHVVDNINHGDPEGSDYTIPGHNYMGPGTKIISNLNNEIDPVDEADFLSLKHDVDYALAEKEFDIINADLEFLANARDWESYAGGSALIAKDLLGFTDYFVGNPNYSDRDKELIKMKMDRVIKHFRDKHP